MADEENPPPEDAGEAAPEASEAAEETPAAEDVAIDESPAEDAVEKVAMADLGAGGPAAPAEEESGAPSPEDEGRAEAEAGAEGGPPVEAEGGESPAEEAPEGEVEAEEAKPPSQVASRDEVDLRASAGALEPVDRKESVLAVKIVPSTASKTVVGERASASVIEEQRRARLEKYGSRAKIALGSVIDIRRGSTTGDVGDRKMARYLNTYKLDSDNPFNPEKVNKILEAVMMEALENLEYDTDKCPKQAKWASSAIRAKLKELEFDRYKLICLVTIGEKHGQDVLVTCRFLWDYDRDRYATFSMENTYVFGIAQCFGLYYE